MTTGSSFTVANARTVVGATCAALLIISLVKAPPENAAGQALTAVILDQSAQFSGLFIHAGGETWYQPLAVYPSRWLLRAGVPAGLALSLPSTIAGMLTVVLASLLAVRVTGEIAVGALTALTLIAMPGFRVAAQTPGAGLWVAPLVIAWVLAIANYLEQRRIWLLYAGGAALAACLYTQPAGVLAVPIFFLLGAVTVFRSERRAATVWSSVIVVVALALPAIVWVVRHRDAYPDTFGRWAIHAAHVRSPAEGIAAFTSWAVMARRADEYWQYLNPTFLFSGAMLGLLLVLLVPYGLWVVGRTFPTGDRAVMFGGFLAAPLAAVLLDMPRQPALVWTLFPFAAMLAAVAARAILSLTLPSK